MKDQGMPLGDFRFCFRYEPCSQELRARVAVLDSVTGAQIRVNLARAAREAEMVRLEAIDRRMKAQMRAEAHDRIGQSMALAAQIRKAGYTAKRSEVSVLRQMARDFDDRTFELFRLGWLDKLPATCEMYVTRVLDQRIADLDDAERQRTAKFVIAAIVVKDGKVVVRLSWFAMNQVQWKVIRMRWPWHSNGRCWRSAGARGATSTASPSQVPGSITCGKQLDRANLIPKACSSIWLTSTTAAPNHIGHC